MRTSYPTTHATSVSETYGNADNLTNQTVTDSNLSGGSQSTTWTPECRRAVRLHPGQLGNRRDLRLQHDQPGRPASAGSDSYTYDQLGTDDLGHRRARPPTIGYNADSALCWSGTGSPDWCHLHQPAVGLHHLRHQRHQRPVLQQHQPEPLGHLRLAAGGTTHNQTYGYNQLGELTCLTASGSAPQLTCASPISLQDHHLRLQR